MSTHVGKLGKQMADLRKTAKLTQVQLAAQAGIHPSTVARFEQGKTRLPRREELEGIARVLRVSVDRLLSLPAEEQSTPLPAEHPPILSADDAHILRAFRGNLRAGRDYVLQADRMAAYDQRLFLEAMEWAIRLIEAGGDWQQRRQERAERDPNGTVNHAGA